jgi:hypothetical protein
MREVKRSTSFFEKKEAKKLFYSGPWALARPKPKAQHKRSLFGSFSSETELLPVLTF